MVTTALRGNLLNAREVAHLLKSSVAMAYSGDPAATCAARALDLVCGLVGWPLGHLYLADQQGKRLVPTDIWHDDDPKRFAPFVAATRGLPLPNGAHLPGRLLASGEPLWIADVARDPCFRRAGAARACGLGAAFGFPVVSPAGIEGVLEFFASHPMEPDHALLDILSPIGLALGTAFHRTRERDALLTSAARLAEAERLGRMGGWRYRIDEDLLEWSDELQTLYGLDPASAPATVADFLARVHPDDVDRVRAGILGAIETGRPFEHEYRLVLGPHDTRWAHSRGERVPPGEDGPAQLSGYCQDITDRKLREEAVRTSEARMAEAQRLAHLGSWSLDLVTNEVTGSNELFRIYGLDPATSPARLDAFVRRVHPEDRDRALRVMRRTQQTLEPFDQEFRVIRPDGQVRWMHSRGEVVAYKDGVAARLGGYCHDITARRSAEEERERLEGQLQQSQRLESLGQLAGGVAHDFNNLLGVILNYAAFVDEEVGEVADSVGDARLRRVRQDIEQIARAARRAAELTRRLLAFGRREVVRPRVLDLNDVVSNVEQLLVRTIGEHVELTCRPAADLRRVSADPGQLEQVLVNLAVNARDAMPSGGELVIETRNVQLDADRAAAQRLPPGWYVQLRVRDTGHGMTREVAARAFEPFFTTKPKGEGTGLGLATVFGIIAQAGGALSIDSEPGRGTTVSVLLPASDRDAPTPDPDVPSFRRVPSGGETVLLVENDEAMREVTRRMLAHRGYQVLSAASGSEAIGLARRHERDIQLLVTDVVMPQMLGKEVAAAVSELAPAVRVLYMSGYAQPVLASQGSLEPGVVLVEKPFSEAELLTRVRELLDRP